ncbi:MAG TPA: hypothetical protein PLC92_08585, partial [Chitinophagales bacterium]|nr:hypothetical protein [Chitinophagales bacterium]
VGSEVFKINQIKDYEQKISKEVFKNSGIYFYQLKVDEKIITTGRITVKYLELNLQYKRSPT